MSDQHPVLTLANGAAAPRTKIPRLPLDAFRSLVIGAAKHGRRVASLFGHEIADAELSSSPSWRPTRTAFCRWPPRI